MIFVLTDCLVLQPEDFTDEDYFALCQTTKSSCLNRLFGCQYNLSVTSVMMKDANSV